MLDTRDEIASQLIRLAALTSAVPPHLAGTVLGAALERRSAELRNPAPVMASFDNQMKR